MHPLFITALVCVGLNGAGFLNGYFRQTDKLTDLLYSLSFALAAGLAWLACQCPNGLGAVLLGLVLLWAFRLGRYLFLRILHMGQDKRFDDMRPEPLRLAGFWVLQTITVWIVLLPYTLVMMEHRQDVPIWHRGLPESFASGEGLLFVGGLLVWLLGFVLETVADAQKHAFKKAHPDQYMDRGLWQRLRHPNYTGEILVWIGFAMVASSGLSSWHAVLAWVSPVWIATLLIKVSGIPLLERSAMKRYGQQADYQRYLSRSHRLIPGLW